MWLISVFILPGCSSSENSSVNQEAGREKVVRAESGSRQSSQAFNRDEYESMVADLFSINLIDSMALSADQYKKLLPLVEEAKTMQDQFLSAQEKDGKELIATLAQIRSMLVKREPITDNEQNRLNKASWETDKITAENRAKTEKLVKDAKSIFTENQIVLIEEYQPCMTPNRSLCQQDRIGEAKDGWRFQEAVERLRKLPKEQFEAEKEKLIVEEETRRKAYYSDEQTDNIIRQMETAIDKARKMDDNEFEMCKIELAKIEMPAIGAPKGKNIVDEAIARFILNPGILDVLRKRANEKS
jgi:hypothetical protein